MNLGNRHSQHSFAQIPSVNTARSKFDRSFAAKDTMNFDYLTPFFIDEMLPGDTVNLNVKTFVRLAPQIRPLMDNMDLDYFFFEIPRRLVWNNWERFNGAQDDPGDSTDFLIPQINPYNGFATPESYINSLSDHFGLPIQGVGQTFTVDACYFRAYNLVYNQWFRDQNLQDSVPVPKGDGPDTLVDYTLLKSNKAHDYFTSMLPWPQKGQAVPLPIGGVAPVVGDGTPFKLNPGNNFSLTPRNIEMSSDATQRLTYAGPLLGSTTPAYAHTDPVGAVGLEVNLAEATATSINTFRQAIMLQSFLELDARGGTRYVEILRSHFNVTSPDFRLQRPELLSIGRISINQHPVAQTSATEGTDAPQGNLAAFSTASETGNRIGFSKSFVEHSIVIGLVRARGLITYQQGVNRFWNRKTREDFFWPKFQELGEQAVLNKELYLSGNPVIDDDVAGYQERHAEYRYYPSQIRGSFASSAPESLDVWHLAEEFDALPALNDEFIQSNTPIERALVVTEGAPHLLCDYFFDYKHVRPMVTYGVPATLGRF